MKNKFFKQRSFYAVFLSVVLSVVLVAGAASAVTTISTNITTGGTLTVSGITTFSGAVNATSTVLVDGVATFEDQVVLDSATSDPTGAEAGALYFDSTNQRVRLYKNDGNWATLASSTDGNGGLVIDADQLSIRFNDISTGNMTLGTTTNTNLATTATMNSSVLVVQATTTGSVPLTIRGPKGGLGTVNLFAVSAHDETQLFAIDWNGNASSTYSLSVGLDSAAASALTVGGMATTSGATGAFSTEGALSILGASTLTGDVSLAGLATTTLSTHGIAFDDGIFSIGGNATTTGTTGNIATEGNLLVNSTTTAPGDGGISATGDIYAGSAGTTTLRLISSVASRPGCLELMAIDGSLVSIYATTTPATNNEDGEFGRTGIMVAAGGCE